MTRLSIDEYSVDASHLSLFLQSNEFLIALFAET